MSKNSKETKIVDYIRENPNASIPSIAKKFITTNSYIYSIRSKHGFSAKVRSVDLNKIPLDRGSVDMVNHPPHYTVGGIETIDFIDAKNLNYALGNAVKYITRAEHKDDKVKDLLKAIWYLNHEIERISNT